MPFARARCLLLALALAACTRAVTPGGDGADAPALADSASGPDGGDVATLADIASGPDGGSAELDLALRYCALVEECNVGSYFPLGHCAAAIVYQQQVFAGWPDPDKQFALGLDRCGESAADCDALSRCQAGGRDAAYCAAHPGVSCDGDVAVDCAHPSRPRAIDCGLAAMHCVLTGPMGWQCTDGVTCDGADASTDGPGRCDGTRRITCGPSSLFRGTFDCPAGAPGSACVEFSDGPICVASSSLCPPTDPPARCDGDVLRSCVSGAAEASDCAAFGFRCVAPEGGAVNCLPRGHDCVEGVSPDVCAGTSIRTCLGGSFRTFDCRQAGLTQCAPSPLAHCM